MKNILLAVSGGIAAYKAIDLTSKLTQSGYEVRVMLTDHAQEFVTPLAFQAISRNPVYTSTFVEENPAEIQHIALGDWADAVIIAPATANVLGKLANGIADDMVTSTLLATTAPKFAAPAMNVHMYENPRVQHNMKVLAQDGYRFAEPGEGFLACGYVAKGRMMEPLDIMAFVEQEMNVLNKAPKQGQDISWYRDKNVLVTAGPTVEVIDPVRYVSNRASGKMGYAIAGALQKRGANVTLVSGPTYLTPPDNVEFVPVTSAEDMFEAVKTRYDAQDMVFKSAAVSDYKPADQLEHKMKKQNDDLSITFTRTQDILKYLGDHKVHQKLIGFAAETQDVEKYAKDKLERKNADVIIANNVGDTSIGFNSDDNEVTLFFKEDEAVSIEKGKKQQLAERILDELERRWK